MKLPGAGVRCAGYEAVRRGALVYVCTDQTRRVVAQPRVREPQ